MLINSKLIKAVEKTIHRWEQIAFGGGADIGMNGSPLCIFNKYECRTCPIACITKERGCTETVYYKFRDAAAYRGSQFGVSFTAVNEDAKEWASQMLLYLCDIYRFLIEHEGEELEDYIDEENQWERENNAA